MKLIVTVAANGQAVDDPVSPSLFSRVCDVQCSFIYEEFSFTLTPKIQFHDFCSLPLSTSLQANRHSTLPLVSSHSNFYSLAGQI